MLKRNKCLLMMPSGSGRGRLLRLKPSSTQTPLRDGGKQVGEQLEHRLMFTADPIQFGAVYTEQDTGSDQTPDAIEISFVGGAADTQLTRLEIDADKVFPGLGAGLSFGDMIFDTLDTGLGVDLPFSATLADRNGEFDVSISVQDGSSLLVLELEGFDSGEKVTVAVDVDEVQDYDPDESDLGLINEELDPIASGAEFQGTQMTAYFSAPHYYDTQGSVEFRNRYDDQLAGTALDLPLDDANGHRDRTAGAVGRAEQTPLPISLSGTVYEDRHANLAQDPGDDGIAGVELSLFKEENGVYAFTGHTTLTDAQGHYVFQETLGLQPGVYEIRESQPDGYFSVGAEVGRVAEVTTGQVKTVDVLTEITISLGGTHAKEYNFAETRPASLRGQVHLASPDGDCWTDDVDHEPIAGAVVQLFDSQDMLVEQTVTDANGEYQFSGLRPGEYAVVEITPAGLLEGGARPGTVSGVTLGVAEESEIRQIQLESGDDGVEYEFCELEPAQLRGNVYHDRDDDGSRENGEEGIAGVTLSLLNTEGLVVDTTETDADGHYEFVGVPAGNYRVVEQQPDGWLDGQDRAGTATGRATGRALNPGDEIEAIELLWGDRAVDYDFGELLPASLRGQVHLGSPAGDCWTEDVLHQPIAGAVVELFDASGALVAETVTDAEGEYWFSGLRPGEYAVVELTPDGLWDGGAQAGQVAGVTRGVAEVSAIRQIHLHSGDDGVEYEFCELEPAQLRGTVYHDHDNDGLREVGEEGIAGAILSLLDDDDLVVATTETDAAGRYEFTDLAAGNYRVVERQPEGWLDGKDRAGTANGRPTGQAVNPGDAIDAIQLLWGDRAADYDFGELLPVSIGGRVHLSTPEGDCWEIDEGLLEPVAGAIVQLYDATGKVLAEAVTDENGDYFFDDLEPGEYTIRETTPAELIDGGAQVGLVDGEPRGNIANKSEVQRILLESGDQGYDYEFCEFRPATISGYVYEDMSNDGQRNTDEPPIAGVTIQLLDEQGQLFAETVTDPNGFYSITGITAGKYTLRQMQPTGYLDGVDAAGTFGGETRGEAVNPGDEIQSIDVLWGDSGVEYNFGELLPATLSGTVHSSPLDNCWDDVAAEPLSEITILLRDEHGRTVAETQTDTAGRYSFANILPGRYSVVEQQPNTHFDGKHRAGSVGGDTTLANQVTDIVLQSGQSATDYDYCELPPAWISGFVFVDGSPIELQEDEVLPIDISAIRNGQLTSDDMALAGVELELRNGNNGQPIDASRALPGAYPEGPVRTTTDENGFYVFSGLPRGSYAVYEIHPGEFVDGIDTPGSTDGIAINPLPPDVEDIELETVINALVYPPRNDAIVKIGLLAGAHSEFNNFSEVLVDVMEEPDLLIPPPQYPGPNPLAPPVTPELPDLYQFVRELPPGVVLEDRIPNDGSDSTVRRTWHLSVIDGGQPRVTRNSSTDEFLFPASVWHQHRLAASKWEIESEAGELMTHYFGLPHAMPITGDFDGDGVSEIGVYVDGHWFIDLNGNGNWDSDDLWAKLGTEGDLPVTGDWDGDGKDDIGIFGREWVGDMTAIYYEHGLPDMDNVPDGAKKNMPPRLDEATAGQRLMKLTARGQLRADLIDHVFLYGTAGDMAVAGDWNGDGIDTVGVFRAGVWRLDSDGDGRWTTADDTVRFGRRGDYPLVGDFNGDGIDELAIVRGGKIYFDTNRNHQLDVNDLVMEFDPAKGLPVVGTWRPDGVDRVGFYRAAEENRIKVATRAGGE